MKYKWCFNELNDEGWCPYCGEMALEEESPEEVDDDVE